MHQTPTLELRVPLIASTNSSASLPPRKPGPAARRPSHPESGSSRPPAMVAAECTRSRASRSRGPLLRRGRDTQGLQQPAASSTRSLSPHSHLTIGRQAPAHGPLWTLAAAIVGVWVVGSVDSVRDACLAALRG